MTGTGRDIQVWLYPEEIPLAGARKLARAVADLGVNALSVALTYHRCVRVFPRYRAVRPGLAGGLQFDPSPSRYGALVPSVSARAVGGRDILALREACGAEGLAFRAWIVVLDQEWLVESHQEYAAATVDGTPTLHTLCPSNEAVRHYAAALTADVAEQFAPDVIDLEAALYPRWNGYLASVSLEPLSQSTKRYGAQCVCSACTRMFTTAGIDDRVAADMLRAAAGSPLGPAGLTWDEEVVSAVASARDAVIAELVAGLRSVTPARTRLRLCGFGSALDVRLQGMGPLAAAEADYVLIGLDGLTGAQFRGELQAHLAIRDPAIVSVGLSWSPRFSGRSLGADAAAAFESGATGLSFYNMSLMPDKGLAAVRTAIEIATPPAQDRR